MASEINANGEVIPPRNIRKPAPLLDTKEFRWRGVHTTAPNPPSPDGHEEQETDLAPMSDSSNFKLSAQRVLATPPSAPAAPGAAPPAAAPPAAHPAAAMSDTDVLMKQLGLNDKREPILRHPLEHFKGAYAGNGFNMIFRPAQFKTPRAEKTADGFNDAFLELNLTTEQWTFGPTLGDIANRGFQGQADVNLGGLPYLQTVQDVTNERSGKGDRVATDKPNGIHLEPGVFLFVPKDASPIGKESIVRMASIPHGTTINAQGLVPPPDAAAPAKPQFDKHPIDTTPFNIGDPTAKINAPDAFPSMKAERRNETLRSPVDLSPFLATGRITTEIIKNPNKVLEKAIEKQDIISTSTFTLFTGAPKNQTDAIQATDNLAMGGGGTANIDFLTPNANAVFMKNTWWIERVLYNVKMPALQPGETVKEVWATMPDVSVAGDTTKSQPSLAPTPVFTITAGPKGVKEGEIIKVPGTQLQYSQTVNLNFGPLTWPHVSVATLVPTAPQPFKIGDPLK